MKAFFESNDNQVNLIEANDIVAGDNYIKFPNGITILWGLIKAPENEREATFIFPFPLYNYQIVATHGWSHVPQGKVTVGSMNENYCKILIYDFNDDITHSRNAHVIVIGHCK